MDGLSSEIKVSLDSHLAPRPNGCRCTSSNIQHTTHNTDQEDEPRALSEQQARCCPRPTRHRPSQLQNGQSLTPCLYLGCNALSHLPAASNLFATMLVQGAHTQSPNQPFRPACQALPPATSIPQILFTPMTCHLGGKRPRRGSRMAKQSQPTGPSTSDAIQASNPTGRCSCCPGVHWRMARLDGA